VTRVPCTCIDEASAEARDKQQSSLKPPIPTIVEDVSGRDDDNDDDDDDDDCGEAAMEEETHDGGRCLFDVDSGAAPVSVTSRVAASTSRQNAGINLYSVLLRMA